MHNAVDDAVDAAHKFPRALAQVRVCIPIIMDAQMQKLCSFGNQLGGFPALIRYLPTINQDCPASCLNQSSAK